MLFSLKVDKNIVLKLMKIVIKKLVKLDHAFCVSALWFVAVIELWFVAVIKKDRNVMDQNICGSSTILATWNVLFSKCHIWYCNIPPFALFAYFEIFNIGISCYVAVTNVVKHLQNMNWV